MKKKKLSLASVYFTFFVDNLCWSIVFPLFAPYFLDVGNILFPKEVSEATRTTILGFFLMAFPLGQFIGAPLLGEYADRYGRRRALMVSVFFTLVGLAITAWSMGAHVLWVLFAGRLITGMFASNMSICLACVTDLSETERIKIKNFGYLSVLAGLSFVLGASLGGKLSDAEVSPLFTLNFPLWIAALLTVFNFLFICFGFRETAFLGQAGKFDLLESFRNIQQALRTEKIKRIYAVYFLFLFAWTILFQFTPVLMVQSFAFTGSDIGDLALYMGLCWAIGSGYLNKLLLHYFSEMRILEWCLILFTILCACIGFPKHLYSVLLIQGFCVIIGGLAWPLCTGVISNTAPRHIQGKVLGISQSVQSLAMTLAPVVGGMVSQGAERLPFFAAAASGLLAIVVYFTLKNRPK